ncbi:MAG TPA: hypothetical protein VFM37_13770 [Pseudonocardiaceae bacterium]|nr:hypothetical protein [Pseudonocardiaceae bacterium]
MRTRQETRPEAKPGRARGRAPMPETPRPDRVRSAAAQRGYARKAQRQAARAGVRMRSARRTPFVLMVMGLLAAGLISSLLLSTAATGDSYRLDEARRQARDLTETAEQLRQQVAAMQTAPELAKRARDLGMVPADEPARLVLRPDGSVEVVGEPTPATEPVPVQPPAPPAADSNQPAPANRPAQPLTHPGAQPPGQPAPGTQPPAGGQPPPAGGG